MIAIAIGALLVFSLDTEQLTVVPLLGRLDSAVGMTATQSAWALSATGIMAAATVPVISRLGDIFGMRRMLLATLAVVAAGNILCAVAGGPTSFILGRAVIGVNAGLAIYYALLRGRSGSARVLDRYVGLMTVAVGAGLALSDVLGGTVIAVGGSVRVVLWIIAGASLAVLAVVWLLVEDVTTRTRVGVDVAGAALLATGLAALVTGIGHGNSWGWGSPLIIGLLIIAVLLLISWGAWELHSPRPLIDLRIARRRDVWPAYALVAVISTIGIILALAVSEYVQTPSAAGYGFGGSVLTAGLYLVPGGLMAAAGGAVAAPVLSRFGQRATALAGGLLATVSFLWFQSTTSRPWELIVLTALSGVSYALVYTAGSSAYLRAARPGEAGMLAGGARVTSTAIAATGPVVLVSLLTSSPVPHTTVPQHGNYGHVWIFLACSGAVICAIATFVRESCLDQRLADHAEIV
ncbi:MAG: MFS transporter [Solirubrobacteraceae bacterium]